MENSQDFLKREFNHLISETLALLGAEKRLVEEIKGAEKISPQIIDKIKKYIREEKERTKSSAALLNTTFSYL